MLYKSTPSTSKKIVPVIANTMMKRERIDSAEGEAGSNMDEPCAMRRDPLMAVIPELNRRLRIEDRGLPSSC
jgi:hypothetical protein